MSTVISRHQDAHFLKSWFLLLLMAFKNQYSVWRKTITKLRVHLTIKIVLKSMKYCIYFPRVH